MLHVLDQYFNLGSHHHLVQKLAVLSIGRLNISEEANLHIKLPPQEDFNE
jgi:hypothetical protein